MKSLLDLKPSGSTLPLLEPVAAPPSTPSGLKCSEETLHCLLAICLGMMGEMLSPDAMLLALMRAQRNARSAGVSDEEFTRVQEIVVRHWENQRRGNPLFKLF